MQKVSSLVSKDISNYLTNRSSWNIFYNAKSEGLAGDGTTDDYADLSTLINTTINGTEATIIFSPGTYKISTNITIPSNISLFLTKGAMLSPDSGKTITINGPVEAGLWKIFTGSGTIVGSMKVEAVYPEWFGAVGDNVTNDTTALQTAINFCNASQRVLDCGEKLYKISGSLTATAGIPKIRFNKLSYGDGTQGCGFSLSGSGYTALTANCFLENVTIHGNGVTANGILHQNPLIQHGNAIRVYNLVGFGMKINKCWDCVYDVISTELCGTSTEYSFSMNDDGDTCNMTHILRLQVERPTNKAIYISPNSLSCVIDNIHSEQAIGDGTSDTWVLGGNRCHYNSFRLNGNVGTNARVHFNSAGTEYTCGVVELDGTGNIKYQAFSGGKNKFSMCEFQAEVSNVTNQVGKNKFDNCKFTSLALGATGLDLFKKCDFSSTVTIGFSSVVPIFEDCVIATLASSSGSSIIQLVRCTITAVSSLPFTGKYYNCTFNTATLSVSSVYCYFYDNTVVNGNVSLSGAVFFMDASRITGNLTLSSGNHQHSIKNGCVVEGTVSAGLLVAPTAGAWKQGDKFQNLKPAASGYAGFICVTDGTPGTWKGYGQLQA